MRATGRWPLSRRRSRQGVMRRASSWQVECSSRARQEKEEKERKTLGWAGKWTGAFFLAVTLAVFTGYGAAKVQGTPAVIGGFSDTEQVTMAFQAVAGSGNCCDDRDDHRHKKKKETEEGENNKEREREKGPCSISAR